MIFLGAKLTVGGPVEVASVAEPAGKLGVTRARVDGRTRMQARAVTLNFIRAVMKFVRLFKVMTNGEVRSQVRWNIQQIL